MCDYYLCKTNVCLFVCYSKNITFILPDGTKSRNRSENGSENGSIKLNICSPSGCRKTFHGRVLTSALVTRTSMRILLRTTGKQNPIHGKLFSFPGLCPDLPWRSGNEVRPSQDSQSSDTKYCTMHKFTIAYTGKNRTCIETI